jgi:hypothetical protein
MPCPKVVTGLNAKNALKKGDWKIKIDAKNQGAN